ncbi:MAG: hypothetical protein J6T72_03710 [Alphaproteobacteria bacterium]|nr:hypothetical protein [Alphaproteobacteria bacterium]
MKKEFNPYLGPSLDEKSETVFLQHAEKQEEIRYLRSRQLSENGEKTLLCNCHPDVVSAYFDCWPLCGTNEPRLIRRKDSTLIRKYVKKFSLGKEAQVLFAQNGRKEDLIFFLRESTYPLYGDTIEALEQRADANELKTYISLKNRKL